MAKIKTALEFVFKAEQLRRICKDGHDILITSYLEEVITQGDQKVGAMRVKAHAKPAKPDHDKSIAPMKDDGTVFGCPIPPCYEEE